MAGSGTPRRNRTFLVHIRDRMCAMRYGSGHETSDLRTYAFKGGARGVGSRAALLRCLRPSSLPDSSSQCSWRVSASDSREFALRIEDGQKRHPRLQREGLGCPDRGLFTPQRPTHRLRCGHGAEALREILHQDPRNVAKEDTFWTLEYAAEVSFEEGLTNRRVSGETIRATLARMGVRWERAKRWIESPDPEYARKKGLETG